MACVNAERKDTRVEKQKKFLSLICYSGILDSSLCDYRGENTSFLYALFSNKIICSINFCKNQSILTMKIYIDIIY